MPPLKKEHPIRYLVQQQPPGVRCPLVCGSSPDLELLQLERGSTASVALEPVGITVQLCAEQLF